jgi:hypothetical protein
MIKLLLPFLLPIFKLLANDGPTVTYELSGGRFGDNITSFLHAKWASFYFNIPIYTTPFLYYEWLKLSQEYPLRNTYPHQITPYSSLEGININEKNRMYEIKFYPEDEVEFNKDITYWGTRRIDIDWKNKEFRKAALSSILPIFSLDLITPPKEKVSIALHLREGGGFDGDWERNKYPNKFPPLHYYLKSIEKVLELLPEKSFYCFIFTDALEPLKYQKCLSEFFKKNKITFDIRSSKIGKNNLVLDDFYSIFNFDIVIRPGSNFTIPQTRLQDYAIVISPLNEKNDLKIELDQIKIEELSQK